MVARVEVIDQEGNECLWADRVSTLGIGHTCGVVLREGRSEGKPFSLKEKQRNEQHA